MKKLLLVVMLQAALFTAFAQKAPTKEETMDWIGGKMKEHLMAPRTFVSYSKGILIYDKKMSSGGTCTTTLDLSKITGMSNEYSSDFFIFGKGLAAYDCGGGDKGVNEYLSISGPNYKEYNQPFDFGMDNGLVERVKKAIGTLMKYNSDKKDSKEAF